MATRRLYWEDPYCKNFGARVEGFELRGDVIALILDQTAFHPEGGGQPSDRGKIMVEGQDVAACLGTTQLKVLKVAEEGGSVAHLVDAASPDEGALALVVEVLRPGSTVRGEIDWAWRFDLMQQHTGQHILSRAFQEVLGAETVGFHLSSEYATIDLAVGSLSGEDVAKVEELSNRVVFDDLPVTVREYDRGDVPPGVRSRFDIEADRVRVVHVGEFDACPCGGTHVASSGQVGLIKVSETDRAHGGVRVVFKCGGRALADYRKKQSLLSDAASAMSQPLDSVPEAVRELLAQLHDLEKRYEEAQQAILDLEIERILNAARGEREGLVALFSEKSPDQLRYAAKRLCEGSGRLSVCVMSEPRLSVVVASPAGGPDARAVAQAISSELGGRGGGTKELAQLGSKEPARVPGSDIRGLLASVCRRFESAGESGKP